MGKSSIEYMKENAAELRKQSKQAVKKRDPFGLAPGSRAHNKLAVTRFNNYRREASLKITRRLWLF